MVLVEQELSLGRKVHAEEARVCDGRACYSEVYFLRSRRTDEPDELPSCRASHNGVVQEHDDSVLADVRQRIELASNFEVPVLLGWSDEASTHVRISEESQILNASSAEPHRLLHEADRCVSGGVRDWDDDRRKLSLANLGDRMFSRKLPTMSTANFGDVVSEYHRVRASEVDVFKDALGDTELVREVKGSKSSRLDRLEVDDDHFSWLHVSDIFSFAEIQRASL
mmetsp:Transcript_44955/g.141518  ORF Transcript_44955/g.141518 Transcript_44955/m.141518 type:complete len:225 (-) Transcript_44955:822-1496(-)